MQKGRVSLKIIPLCVCILLPWACSHGKHVRPVPRTKLLRDEKRVLIPQTVQINHILKTAQSYVGTPYRFGGNSSQGTDCSGFTQMVFQKHGIALPHSSWLQAQFGDYISRASQLKPGDLVFFETYKKGPSHVGIYLGKKRFIHASSGQGRVVIDPMGSSYYRKRFLGGKRLFD